MSQDALVLLADQTLAICAAGVYQAPSGTRVSLATVLAAATAGTVMHDLADMARDPGRRSGSMPIEVRNESTFAGARRLVEPGHHVAVLNFASAKTPGGGFQRGTMAQEESLAYASGLYMCLARMPAFYARNREYGSPLYLDLAIFSPGIPFFRDEHGALLEASVLASVITVPAPNARAIAERGSGEYTKLKPTLRRRAELVLAVAAAHRVDRLVLGAWGCGVFGNDPATVARIFAELLGPAGAYAQAFEAVVFSVLDRSPAKDTLRAFQAALG